MPYSEAYFISKPTAITRKRIVLSTPSTNQVQIRFLYCGICGSDVSKYLGYKPVVYPYSIGHEFIGEIEAVGRGVTQLKVGDFVTSDIIWRCGKCDYCRTQRSHLCVLAHKKSYSNLAFSQRAVFHERYVTRLASDTPSLHFALAEPLSCALHALSKVQIIDDDEVLLVGCGGLGTCIAYALYANTIGVKLHLHDLVEPRVIGLVNCLPERFKKVGKLRKSYDVVLDASGTPQGLIAAIEHTKSGGKLVSLSHVDGRSGTDRLWDSIARKDLQLHFSYLNGEALNLTKAIELLKVHWNSNWNELVKIVPIDELESAMRYRNDSPFNKEICTIWSQL